MDFSKVKSEILNVCQSLAFLNSSYKDDQNVLNFMTVEKVTILKLSEQIKTSVNILKKLKRKANVDIALFLPMKRKKLAEKELVSKQLNDQTLNRNQFEKNKLRKLINQDFYKPEMYTESIQINNLVCLSKICYICKNRFTEKHHFYDQICSQCGDFSYAKRQQTCDLNGKTAVVTGCRIKIGYKICLYLLRNNCSQVIGTTRFPKDAYQRFSHEPDFNVFKARLKIYPLDLRDLNSINMFVSYLNNSLEKLDILINNAAQTIRRSVKFYEHLIEIESQDKDNFDKSILVNDQKNNYLELKSIDYGVDLRERNVALSVKQSQIALVKEDFDIDGKKFPTNVFDKDGQQVDLSHKCSWNKKIDEVDMLEFGETQIINSWAPFMLCSKLKDLMCRKNEEPKFVVNVSSMEGKFNRYKNITHPHTNMSKASLNMLTRTCGADFARHNVFMTSVDTGWVSEMNPKHLYENEKTVPLDEMDGAIRVLDPIIQGYNKNIFLHSIFLKDFKPTQW